MLVLSVGNPSSKTVTSASTSRVTIHLQYNYTFLMRYNSKMDIIFGLALLTLAVAGPTYRFNNVHENMTDEELKKIFQADHHDGMTNII